MPGQKLFVVILGTITVLSGVGNAAAAANDGRKPSCCMLTSVIPLSLLDSKSFKKDTSVRLARARDFFQDKDYTNAFVECGEALKAEPQNYACHYMQGAVLMAMLDFAEAGREFQQAIDLQPDAGDAHFMLAQSYRMRRMYNEAVQAYRECLKYQPENALPHAYLAECYRIHGLDWTVAPECARAIALDEKCPLPHTILAQWHLSHARVEQGLAEYEKALTKSPDDPYVYFRYGQSLGELERWKECESALRKAVALDPRYADARIGLAWCLSNQNKLTEAVAVGKDSVALAPTDADAHLNLAYIYKKHSDPDLAVIEYKQARALRPESLKIRRALAMALSETHNLDEAIAEMSLVSQAMPLDEDVKLQLHALLQLKKKHSASAEELR
jgi:Tfp pilus assembly protein PilF